jgi:hypothetical protein
VNKPSCNLLGGLFFLGGVILALFYLNKSTGITWQVDDKEIAQRLDKDSNFELIKPEEKNSIPVVEFEKPSKKQK